MEFEEESSKDTSTHAHGGHLAQEHLLHHLKHLLRGSQNLPDYLTTPQGLVEISDIAVDLGAFESQISRPAVSETGVLAVNLRAQDWPRAQENLLVPVDIGDARSPEQIIAVLNALKKSALPTEVLSRDQGREHFRDRAAEAIALRAMSPPGLPPSGLSPPGSWNVQISSRQAGADILCAKGWFFSTTQVVGQSTCHVALRGGRYSFGVYANNVSQFHPHLWTVPTSGPITLALP